LSRNLDSLLDVHQVPTLSFPLYMVPAGAQGARALPTTGLPVRGVTDVVPAVAGGLVSGFGGILPLAGGQRSLPTLPVAAPVELPFVLPTPGVAQARSLPTAGLSDAQLPQVNNFHINPVQAVTERAETPAVPGVNGVDTTQVIPVVPALPEVPKV
jgi:hypothetical protein